jgi:hypothetical protein
MYMSGVDTKLLSLLALLSNKTNEMQLTASFENEYRRHSLLKSLNITFPFDVTDLQHSLIFLILIPKRQRRSPLLQLFRLTAKRILPETNTL